MYQQRMKDAIEAIKKGEMIIIMDDEDRENEGDLVMAGIFSTPEKINFMAQEARGLICVSITKELAHKLDLPPMVQRNDSNHETAFTISIDAKSAKTGISAYERDLTIRLMCDNNAKPNSFVRPGHIFPLIAKDGGTLIRTGHTEASVDICRLAGLTPVSVICEIMKKDGTMAGRGDKFLLDFAKEHNLKILYVSDIIQYRLNFENLVREVSRTSAVFMGQKCEKITFLDHLCHTHVVFSFDSKAPANSQEHMMHTSLVRFHNTSSDVTLLENPSEWQALNNSVALLRQGGGYLICLYVSTRDSELKDIERSSGDIKDFGIGAQILKHLNVKNFTLLSSHNTNKSYNALSGFDLHLSKSIEVQSTID